MNRGVVVVALGILLALFVLAVDRLVESPPRLASPAPVATRATRSHAAATVLDAAVEPSTSAQVTPQGSTNRREPEGIWIRGRVQIPAGLPPDDHVEVAARYVSLEEDSAGVSTVDDEGRFLVAFPADVEEGWLELRSRYLYLEQQFEVDLEDPPAEVVLEPALGGCVRGRFVPSQPARDLTGTRVEMCRGPGAESAGAPLRILTADSELGFEITAVPPCSDYVLSLTPRAFLPARKSVHVLPGRTTDVRIELHARARVSGRIVDPEGEPVDRALVLWAEARDRGYAEEQRLGVNTSADGSFSLSSDRSGPSTLLVRYRGCMPERRELGSLKDGQEVEGLVIQLRSARISGAVLWADGRPVRKCSLVLAPSRMDPDQARRFLRFGKSDIQSSSNPQFSFYVDSEGPFHLNVHTDPTDESAVSGATGIAFVDDIHPGQPPLTVLLRPARTVHGQVVDDLGHPIPAFSISACPASDAAAAFLGEAIHSNFHSEDGVFALGGLAERVWTFSADALGVHGPESEPVEVPNSAVLVLVVPRPAELSGVVLEPSGTPAAFAEVDPCSGGSPKTDASGRSRLTQVEPGTVRLTASSKSWAPSEPLSVEVKPGEKLGDLVLRLRKGGRIAGSVFDADGHEESGSVVWIESADGEDSWSLESDAGGRFESGILVPGDYTVSRRSDRIGPDDQERENLTESVSVTVIENQVTSVVIGRAR